MMRIASLILCLTASAAMAGGREFSFDMWDWTPQCRDLATFKVWAADLKSIGVTRIEISAPWNVLEPKPGEFDLSFITDRLAVVKSHGMGMRIRINSFWNGATPAWYQGDRWCDIEGKPPVGAPTPVSFTDERFWEHYGLLCTTIAEVCRGEDVYLNAFIGIHAELKWSDWWSYDASALKLWRETIRNRPAWLVDLVGDAPLPDVPPVPKPTNGTPDTSPVSIAWIAFRQEAWREAMRRFNAAVRRGDPEAKTSVPLGESYRAGSAQMSNLDYFGLSRGAQQIVHSYDFFWHTKDEPWQAAATVAAFRGISGFDNISFEFDGMQMLRSLGYDDAKQIAIAKAAMSQGAGLKVANYGGEMPSKNAVLVEFGKLARDAEPFQPPPPEQTVLLFISKWVNYCYREPSEWVHEAQFAVWRSLTQRNLPVRIICEDNLSENLSRYHGLCIAPTPDPKAVMSAKQRAALERWSKRLTVVAP